MNGLYYKLKLTDLYPDKKVANLKKDNPRLYRDLRSECIYKGITINQFLANIGFECIDCVDFTNYEEQYNIQNITSNVSINPISEEEVVSELLKLYPQKEVFMLKQLDESLYYQILKKCQKNKIKTNEYLTTLGFRVLKTKDEAVKSIGEGNLNNCKYIAEKILKNCKSCKIDEEVKNLFTLFQSLGVNIEKCQFITPLYNIVVKRANELNMELNDYIESLGFKVPNTWCFPTLIEQIRELYPDNIITDFSANHALYRRTYNKAKKEDMTIEEYCESLGFKIFLKYPGQLKNMLSNKNEQEVKELEIKLYNQIVELYPDKILKNIEESQVYPDLIVLSVQKKQSIQTLLKDFGFNLLYV
ncbi:MAG: hypothetical protein K0R54_216 [Clostridiaceae bacterium]|jgi:hypothetical protein|nr:hypothetical protein [Clostridiaceae bacterium]